MNRAVFVAAVASLVVLLVCGAWLLWREPAPSRLATTSREHTSAPGSAESAPGVLANLPKACEPSPAANAPAPGDGASQPEPGQANQPGQPAQPRPDFNRLPGTSRPLPMEMESKKFVSVTISGRVQLENNMPVAGADVCFEVVALRRMKGTPDDASSPLQKVAVSDREGGFVFSFQREIFESAKLTAYVSARAHGYGPSPVVSIEVAGGGSFPATLVMREGGAVRGRVVDAQGNAIAGVTVALGKQAPLAERPAHSGLYYEALTDNGGNYAIEDVVVGNYSIGVLSYAHDFRAGPKTAAVVQGGTQLEDIVVEVVISIRVRLVDSTGATVAGSCTLNFHDGKKVVQRLGTMVPEDGVIVLGYPPAGTFDVTARVDGYFESAPTRLTFALGQTTDGGTITLTKDPNFVKQH